MGRFDEMVKKAESCVSHNNKTGKCSRNGYAPIDCMTCNSYRKKQKQNHTRQVRRNETSSSKN